jgi:threonine/homoserine/homoserine lactone efflux protein
VSTTSLLSFTVVALLTVITPGPDTLLVVRTALLGGRRAGLAAILGITSGCLAWAIAGLVGLAALLTVSEVAYNIVRIAGAAYLIWLGGSALWKSRKGARPLDDHGPQASTRAWAGFRAGLLSNVLNPKAAVFYVSLLPQFLPTGSTTVGWGMVLAGIHVGIGLVWLPILVWLATRARQLLLRERVRLWLDRVTATVLVGLGVKVALDARP